MLDKFPINSYLFWDELGLETNLKDFISILLNILKNNLSTGGGLGILFNLTRWYLTFGDDIHTLWTLVS